jgi:predicted transcriptional regulator
MLSARSIGRGDTSRRRRGPQKPKRTVIEIYYDILTGIEGERAAHILRKTKVQQNSNLSYDKFSRYLQDMAEKGLVNLEPLSITEKGREFLHDYHRIRAFMAQVGAKFFESKSPWRYGPSEFVASLPSGHHSVLFYDNREYAWLVAARFLSEGLLKGESCVYLAFEDSTILERKLQDLGVDVSKAVRENRLRFYPGKEIPQKLATSLEGVKKLVEDLTRGMKPPFRIFGNFAERFQGERLVEELLHEKFDELGITMLCWYDLTKLSRPARLKVVEWIIQKHNHVIFASEPSKAFGLDSSLLRAEG